MAVNSYASNPCMVGETVMIYSKLRQGNFNWVLLNDSPPLGSDQLSLSLIVSIITVVN